MSSPSGASHTHSGKFAPGCGTDKAVHRGHLLLHGDRQAKGGQVKSPRTLTGKIYNKRSVDLSQSGMSEDDNNNFEDNFDEEFDEEEETGFGNARGRRQLVSDSWSPQT
jgi:hypothetical protein